MIVGAFYTKGEAAKTLGKDKKTIYRWLRSGKMQGERVGTMVLIAETEVERVRATLDSGQRVTSDL